MSEQLTRARSALERVWKPLGKYAVVCGEWTVCNFRVNGAEKFLLSRGRELVGYFDTQNEAMNEARRAA